MTAEETAFVASQFIRCRPYLRAALEYDLGTRDLDDVWDLVRTGVAKLWPAPNSATVTLFELHPKKKVLNIWLAGGDLEELRQVERQIEGWARAQGCDLILINGRKGWLRALDGYAEGSTILVKDLGATA